MFKRSKKPTDRPFVHDDNCAIVKADPNVTIEWEEIETGKWQRTCQCGIETVTAQTDETVRLDPHDPATFRHAPQCEYKDVTDDATLRLVLTVKPGLAGGYLWVSCSDCDCSWPVPSLLEGAAS
jgi:hypothetical protein